MTTTHGTVKINLRIRALLQKV